MHEPARNTLMQRGRARWALAGAVALAFLTSCEPYRIEHVKRPAFYQKASKQELPSEVVLADGTIVRYSTPEVTTSLGMKDDDGKVFEPREEIEDEIGRKTVTLRAILPEHVLFNTLTCLRNQEYELLWAQGLSDRTKHNYAQIEQGEHEFTAFMQKHRHELVATLTRMMTGMSGQEVAVERIEEGLIRCRLRPQYAAPFKFTKVDMVKENGWLKLVLIHD